LNNSSVLPELDPKKNIIIEGAQMHNLKDIDVVLPRNKWIVITGVSGSGKSSLAFDTLYAEGQRRYVESLSAYARQFLGKLEKPKVRSIKGIAPAIAIEQKVRTNNPRSTVGTTTEIYDYLKLLFARIGITIDPVTGRVVKKEDIQDVWNFLQQQANEARFLLLSPKEVHQTHSPLQIKQLLIAQGYARVWQNNQVVSIQDADLSESYELVIDRIVLNLADLDFEQRLKGAIELAFFEGKGTCIIRDTEGKVNIKFDNRFQANGVEFLEPSPNLFSFNNPYGACPQCEGYGDLVGIDPDLVIPNTSLTLYEGAIAPWKGDRLQRFKDKMIEKAASVQLPIHTPWHQLTADQQRLVWEETKAFKGLNLFFAQLEQENYKIQNRVLLSRYRGKTTCPSCRGKRLRPEAFMVFVGGFDLGTLMDMPVEKLHQFFEQWEPSPEEWAIGKRLILEIKLRLQYLMQVGLPYLTLNRKSNSLSGGESQRIHLATSLGSSLVGSMYILDEPSIGLHPRDTEHLIKVLQSLRDLGNTVICVEHDEDMMRACDWLVDIGPEAGVHGGQVTASGTLDDLMHAHSLTADYLHGRKQIALPKKRRNSQEFIKITGARSQNLKNITVSFPLHTMTAVTGVSGSGKSTLVKSLIYPLLQKKFTGTSDKIGPHDSFEINSDDLGSVEWIDQNPIGRSSRSNPVTYIKAYDDIRSLYAGLPLSKNRGYQSKHFSFNVAGGRCEKCQGEGSITIEMQFMADVHIECDQCQGKRFQSEILEVNFQGKNIFELLQSTVSEALAFFGTHGQKKIAQKLKALDDVGLGYVALGQSSATLSGGEAQRIKLASFLLKGQNEAKTLFIFDEPTTGLHLHDIDKLLKSLNALIDKGHSILLVEHHMDVVKCADYVIDLGPEAGDQGGHLVVMGTPEQVVAEEASHTGKALKKYLLA
jgi:excinuclease ABC subunit A